MSPVRFEFAFFNLIVVLSCMALFLAVLILAVILIVRACRRRETPSASTVPSVSAEIPTDTVGRSLAEKLKETRLARGMTQEFVAESLGISRQAVSKWETGAADPSTGNLLALAKLYGVSAADLLE